jgi:hypothetical protein
MKCYLIYNKTHRTYLNPIEQHWAGAPAWVGSRYKKHCLVIERREADRLFERTKNFEIRGLTVQFQEVEVPAEEVVELLQEQADALSAINKMSYKVVKEEELE